MKNIKTLVLLATLTWSTYAVEEYGSSQSSKMAIIDSTAEIILKKYKNIPAVFNHFKSRPELFIKSLDAKSEQEKEELIKFVRSRKVKFLPAITMKKNTLIFKYSELTVTTTVVDLLKNQFKINGKAYKYDKTKSHLQNYKVFENLTRRNFSLIDFIIPNAYAARIPSENIYLALALLDSYSMNHIFLTADGDLLSCIDRESIRKDDPETEKRCADVSQRTINHNITVLVESFDEKIESCKYDLEDKNDNNKQFSRMNKNHLIMLDVAPVETYEYQSETLAGYLFVSELERNDREAQKDVKAFLSMYFQSEYVEKDAKIENINDLTCEKLINITRKSYNSAAYSRMITNRMCKKIAELQECHKELFHSEKKLRKTINNYSRKFKKPVPDNYYNIPKIRAVNE